MAKNIRSTALALSLGLAALVSCRYDMQDQPKYKPYRGSELFGDSLSSRMLVEGTVPRGYLREDQELYTGKTGAATTVSANTTSAAAANGGATGASGSSAAGGAAAGAASGGSSAASGSASTATPSVSGTDVNAFPFPITREVLDRGQERYGIYCAPCHGVLGDGRGMIVLRGFRQPPSYHIDRLRTAPVGHFFDVMTNGFGAMPDYSMQIPPHERWAIIAYIRALQLSQNANVADVPPSELAKLK